MITGFLGAGKTSLIRHLLANGNGRRLALVINEFGELGVDRELLLGCGIEGCAEDDVIELANGCICCTVADDFLPTMEKLLARAAPPDHIVIETSGLALPKPLVKAFAWPEVASRVTVDGVIAVVDAAALLEERFAVPHSAPDGALHENSLEEVFSDQLACADLVLLNKADLIGRREADDSIRGLRAKVRAGVPVIAAVHGRADPRVILGLSAAAEDDLGSRPTRHDAAAGHDHDDFESFAVRLGPVADRCAFEARLRETAIRHELLRIKGFAEVSGKALRLAVQGVGPRLSTYFDRPWRASEARAGHLVVIGEKGLERAAIAHGLGGRPAAAQPAEPGGA